MDNCKYINKETHTNALKRSMLRNNDILISIAGTLGRCAVVETNQDININQAICFVRLYEQSISPHFLKYYILSPIVQKKLTNKAKITAIPNLTLEIIKKIVVNIPPLNEQKRIVEKIESEFEKIDKGIEHLTKAKEQIKQYRRSILAKFYNRIGSKPCTLGSCFEIVNGDRGKNYPSKNKLHSAGIPFVSAINIMNSELREDNLCCLSNEQYELLRNGKINNGDTLLCIRGSIGKHCRYYKDKGAIASSMVILRQANTEEQNQYLHYYLDSPLFYNEIKKYDNGTAQPNLSAADLRKFYFPDTNTTEQQKIVEEIEKRFKIADEVEKIIDENLKKAKQLKQSILKKAFEGRLIPQDPNDEPASVLLEKIKSEREKNERK